jgi:TatD DNase family protein
MPKLFDIHSHLNDTPFDQDLEEALSRMREKDVWTITVGTDKKMSQKACDLSEKHDGLYASIGMHPRDNVREKFDPVFYRELGKKYSKVVAIGECGLDYFRVPAEGIEAEKKRQRALFEEHIELAVSLDKPLMIHCRDAHEDVLGMLRSKKREYGGLLRADIHFFSGGIDVAKEYLELDFTLSFTGVITFARQYDEVIAYAPLTHIMSETDAPYVAPVPYRNGRCEPFMVEEVVKKIAEIRGEDNEVVERALVDNALRVFKISLS